MHLYAKYAKKQNTKTYITKALEYVSCFFDGFCLRCEVHECLCCRSCNMTCLSLK
jgi:hypothetical protein